MNERNNNWIQTYSGRQFWPLDPRLEDVHLRDIAHALSQICRYNGHCNRFYSVAEHCVYVSRYCSPENRLWGLMHDAAEAYLCDLVRPIKNCFPDFSRHELRLLSIIGECFGFSLPIPDEVKTIDYRILANEKKALMAQGPAWILAEPLEGLEIVGWTPNAAKAVFITTFSQIMEAHGSHGFNES